MSNDNHLAEAKNLCNEIGGAVLRFLVESVTSPYSPD